MTKVQVFSIHGANRKHDLVANLARKWNILSDEGNLYLFQFQYMISVSEILMISIEAKYTLLIIEVTTY